MKTVNVDAQELAIRELANGASKTDAAEVAGVHRSTVANWEATDPNFSKRLKEERDRAAAHFGRILGKSVAALEELVERADSDAVRLAAVKTVLARAIGPEKDGPRDPVNHDGQDNAVIKIILRGCPECQCAECIDTVAEYRSREGHVVKRESA